MEKMEYVRAQMDVDEFAIKEVIMTSLEPVAPDRDLYEGNGF